MERFKVNGRDIELRCPVCGAWLPVLRSSKEKPYAVCNVCGVQTFIRYQAGIDRLKEAAEHPDVENVRYEPVESKEVEASGVSS